jgi:Asp-tRNA(Asn)/Glu-tRNA(Gln) amidotransferase A subunit family amidase
MKNQIVIYPDEISKLAEEGGKLVFKKEAEEELVKLLEIKKKIDKAIEKVKEQIKQAGESILPNFKGVEGRRVKAIYSYHGAKYEIQDPQKAQGFYRIVVYEKPDTETIDNYVKEYGELPEGVVAKEREKSLSLRLKENVKSLEEKV